MAARKIRDLLLGSVMSSVSDALGPAADNEGGPVRVGVAYSGGVDSALVSGVCHKMGYDTTLLTTGFAGSHDVLFARRVNAEHLRLPHHILEIDGDAFADIALHVRGMMDNNDSLSWHENCIAFYYVSKLAGGLGIDTVVTANGIDELFCGYDAYRREFDGGRHRIDTIMDDKLDNEHAMMAAVSRVASGFGVRILQPLLCPPFIRHARAIPLSEKILGSDDLLRKHIIRQLACDIGVPEISYTKRKKALQYGSMIHKALLRTGVAAGRPRRAQADQDGLMRGGGGSGGGGGGSGSDPTAPAGHGAAGP